MFNLFNRVLPFIAILTLAGFVLVSILTSMTFGSIDLMNGLSSDFSSSLANAADPTANHVGLK